LTKGGVVTLFLFIYPIIFGIYSKNISISMNFINLNSNRGIVNLFADYILKQINKDNEFDTVIEVTDSGKFFVINGLTNRKELLDINDIKIKFSTEYSNLLNDFGYTNINVIDLISYNVGLEKKEDMWLKFYASERILYPQDLIDTVSKDLNNIKYHSVSPELVVELDYSENTLQNEFCKFVPMTVTSEFPHGHSLSMGRSILYYSEYICNHLESSLRTGDIVFKFSTKMNDNDDYDISITTDSMYKDSDITSVILDVFDFNLTKFTNEIKGYDVIKDITNPFDSKPWLVKDKSRDIFII